MIDTRDSLLGRLKIQDAHEAWQEFFHLYWGAITRYARKLGLSQHQAEEVLQETMVALMRILPEFEYDRRRGRFRNFLLTIVHRKSLAVLRRSRRESALPFDTHDGATTRWTEEQPSELAIEALRRWREAVVEEALQRLRGDPTLGENTFAIFHAYAVERRPTAEVAAQFGVKENAVYQIKNRLLRRLQAEVAELLRSGGSDVDEP